MADKKYPITIITGFLGSGKTTLLNRILSEKHEQNIAVLVNDFGAINIDAELIIGVKDDVISLANGCVCCNIRGDLIESIEKVIKENDQIDAILLEASGVADPVSIAQTFLDPVLQDRMFVENIVCLIDTEQFFNDWEYEGMRKLKLLQIGCADLVLLNKVDLVDKEHVQKVKEFIDEQFNRIRMIETTEAKVPIDILFDNKNKSGFSENLPSISLALNHEQSFAKWSFNSSRPFNLDALEYMVRKELPASVYRCKGLVYSSDSAQEYILQIVGRRVRLTKFENNDRNAAALNKIVAIGNKDELDNEHLTMLFEKCLVNTKQIQ